MSFRPRGSLSVRRCQLDAVSSMLSVAQCRQLLDAIGCLMLFCIFPDHQDSGVSIRFDTSTYIAPSSLRRIPFNAFQCMRKRANKQTKGTVSAVPLSEVRRFDEHHLPTNSFMQNCSFGRERCVLDNVIDSENFSVSQTLASELRIERTSVAEFSRPSKLLNQPIGCFIAFSAHYCVRRNAIQWAPVSLAVAVVH